jgi:glycosyltransferase involved in cell wall biosynthesis
MADAMRALSPATVVIPPYSVAFTETALPAGIDAFMADHAPLLVCVGLYGPVYGFEEAVDLVAALRPAHPRVGLLLIGDMASSESCAAKVEAMGLTAHVKMCGNLGHDECTTVMRRCSVFLRLTQYDGDSLSVREALALGVPVVATATDFRPAGVTLYQRGAVAELAEKVGMVLRKDLTAHTVESDSSNLEEVNLVYRQAMRKADGPH